MAFRKPTADELRLLEELAALAHLKDSEKWLATIEVDSMNDGHMGSLKLSSDGSDQVHSSTGKVTALATLQFEDDDGVQVIATLNANEGGVPIEVDVWKTDFSRLRRIPAVFPR
jgi:hypothetical protein